MDRAVDRVGAALLIFFEQVPELLHGELNLTGPLLTVTLCGVVADKRHFTVVPFETVTFGTAAERTK